MKRYNNERVLCIADLHAPYQHEDTIKFLSTIKDTYLPDRVVLLGDELDNNSISYHGADPDLFSPIQELQAARDFLSTLYEMFPQAVIIKSNHGELVHRKVVSAGLSRGILKNYNELYGVGNGWQWFFDITITLPTRQQVYFVHQKNSCILRLSKAMAMNVVQGHYHSKMTIDYWANPNDLFWGMQLGCLLDDNSLAFAYNKKDTYRPLIGVGMIIEGLPKLIPMVLTKQGRWNGRIT